MSLLATVSSYPLGTGSGPPLVSLNSEAQSTYCRQRLEGGAAQVCAHMDSVEVAGPLSAPRAHVASSGQSIHKGAQVEIRGGTDSPGLCCLSSISACEASGPRLRQAEAKRMMETEDCRD
jgi:hypothetical protein